MREYPNANNLAYHNYTTPDDGSPQQQQSKKQPCTNLKP